MGRRRLAKLEDLGYTTLNRPLITSPNFFAPIAGVDQRCRGRRKNLRVGTNVLNNDLKKSRSTATIRRSS